MQRIDRSDSSERPDKVSIPMRTFLADMKPWFDSQAVREIQAAGYRLEMPRESVCDPSGDQTAELLKLADAARFWRRAANQTGIPISDRDSPELILERAMDRVAAIRHEERIRDDERACADERRIQAEEQKQAEERARAKARKRGAQKKKNKSDRKPRGLTTAQTDAIEAYFRCDQNQTKAATFLGITRQTFKERLDGAREKMPHVFAEYERKLVSKSLAPLPEDSRGQVSIPDRMSTTNGLDSGP